MSVRLRPSPCGVAARRRWQVVVSLFAHPAMPLRNPTPLHRRMAWTSTKSCPRPFRFKSLVSKASSPSSSSYVPYPFNQDDYHRVDWMYEPYGPMVPNPHPQIRDFNAIMILQQPGCPHAGTNLQRVLEVFVSGETAQSLYASFRRAQGEPIATRPSPHDVLWKILERGQQISKREWRVLRMAVVSIEENVYIGRLFFGDPDTQTVMWDMDVRPSDGCYVARRAGAPIFVHRSVWESCTTPLTESECFRIYHSGRQQQAAQAQHVQAAQQQAAAQRSGASSGQGATSGASGSVPSDLNAASPDDPSFIQLLKRELAVALAEENYSLAVSIRDHPWMQRYRQIQVAKMEGMASHAAELEEALKKEMEAGGF